MKSGIVKWFNLRKGCGVIKPIDGGFNVYVNIAAVERAGLTELKEGQRVNFGIVLDNLTGKVFADNLSLPSDKQDDTIPVRSAFRGERTPPPLRVSSLAGKWGYGR